MILVDYLDRGCDFSDVRLSFREQGNATGNLEICFNDEWHLACASSLNLGQSELNVTCRTLGFGNEFQLSRENNILVPSIITGAEPVLQGDTVILNCTGDEQDLSDCARIFDRRRKRQSVSCEQPARISCQCK